MNVVLSPVALNGPILTIRRFPDHPIGMKELRELGSITEEADLLLSRLVKAKYNIFISGGTGSGKITIRELIKSSLRMRPDRIIVGEVRGGEAIDMMQCLNTGHDGSMSTGHANSSGDMLSRLETMILMGMELPLAAIRQQIAAGLDIIVHLGRLRDKSRKVLEIVEVEGVEGNEIKIRTLYAFEEEGEENGKVKGKLIKRGELRNDSKLKTAGIMV